jgi:ABC-type uncharacterized transport system ATPase component
LEKRPEQCHWKLLPLRRALTPLMASWLARTAVDEHTAADPKSAGHLTKIIQRDKLTTLMVTH